MKVRFALPYLKRNLNDWIQSFDLLSEVIARRIERQTVEPSMKILFLRQQLSAPALSVRARQSQHAPFAGRVSPLQPHGQVFRRLALTDIQNVR